jgi:mono/diheme cytochrome c family protein
MTWLTAGVVLFLFGLGLAGTSARVGADDRAQGEAAFSSARCPRCHGDDALGATGPPLVPMAFSIDRFRKIVRTGNDVMPAFTEEELPDADVAAIHRYLGSLAAQ